MTRLPRTHWTRLAAQQGGDESAATLDEMIEEFKHCFGEQIGIDLSEASEEAHAPVQLSDEEVGSIFADDHPHWKLEDFPELNSDYNHAEGDTLVTKFATGRLQSELEAFFISHMPSLVDPKKVRMKVNDEDMNDIANSIHEILHEYKAAGVLKDLASDVTNEKVRFMLEIAFGNAIEFHRPRREVKR